MAMHRDEQVCLKQSDKNISRLLRVPSLPYNFVDLSQHAGTCSSFQPTITNAVSFRYSTCQKENVFEAERTMRKNSPTTRPSVTFSAQDKRRRLGFATFKIYRTLDKT